MPRVLHEFALCASVLRWEEPNNGAGNMQEEPNNGAGNMQEEPNKLNHMQHNKLMEHIMNRSQSSTITISTVTNMQQSS